MVTHRIAGLSIAAALAGCASLSVPAPAPPPPIVTSVTECPSVHEFTDKQNADLAAALRSLPAGSIWHDVAEDDQKMRAQARACIAAKEGQK